MKKYSEDMAFCLLLCGKRNAKKIFSVLFPQQLNDHGSIGVAKIWTEYSGL